MLSDLFRLGGRLLNAGRVKAKLLITRQDVGRGVLQADIADVLLTRTRDRFRRQVDPNDIPWLPLSPKTPNSRGGVTRQGILFITGTLYESIQISDNTMGRLRTGIITGAGFRIGSDLPYARYHNLGIGVPQREFLGISSADVRMIESRLKSRVQRNLDR